MVVLNPYDIYAASLLSIDTTFRHDLACYRAWVKYHEDRLK